MKINFLPSRGYLSRLALSFGILSLLLTSCSRSLPTSSSPSPAQSQNNLDTLKILAWQAPTILNPHLSTGFKDGEASRISLEPLASFDSQGQLIPG